MLAPAEDEGSGSVSGPGIRGEWRLIGGQLHHRDGSFQNGMLEVDPCRRRQGIDEESAQREKGGGR